MSTRLNILKRVKYCLSWTDYVAQVLWKKQDQWRYQNYYVQGRNINLLEGVSLGVNHLCCDLAESVRSQEHWLWDIARKRNEFILFSIVLRILLITLEPLDWVKGNFSKMQLSKWSNRILKMSHVWVLTDFPRSHHIWERTLAPVSIGCSLVTCALVHLWPDQMIVDVTAQLYYTQQSRR